MQDAMGIFQHHDAVTGTSKQFVADDYVYRLSKAMDENKKTYSKLIGDQAFKDFGIDSDTWEMCTV